MEEGMTQHFQVKLFIFTHHVSVQEWILFTYSILCQAILKPHFYFMVHSLFFGMNVRTTWL